MDLKSITRVGYVFMTVGFLWGSFLLVKHPGMVEWTPYGLAFMLMAVGAGALRWC